MTFHVPTAVYEFIPHWIPHFILAKWQFKCIGDRGTKLCIKKSRFLQHLVAHVLKVHKCNLYTTIACISYNAPQKRALSHLAWSPNGQCECCKRLRTFRSLISRSPNVKW